MKRVGNLWEGVIGRGNLVLAFHRAARGKRRKQEVLRFEENLDGNLEELREALVARTFQVGQFKEDGVGTEYYFVVARNNQHLVSSYFATDASDIH